MKNKRFQYNYRKNSSSLHKKVGEILRTSPTFKHHKIYQEYSVNKINPSANNKWRFDWVIVDLKVVIECHGIQHTTPTAFNKEDVVETVSKFLDGQSRDKEKERLAREAGYSYIVIDYTEEKNINITTILERIYADKTINDYSIIEKEEHKHVQKNKEYTKEYRKKYLASEKHQKKLEQAREKRKEKYRKLKQFKNEQ